MADFTSVADAITYAADTLRREASELDRLATKQRTREDPGPSISAVSVIAQVAQMCRPDMILSRVSDALGAL